MFIYLMQVDQALLASARNALDTEVSGDGQTSSITGPIYAQDFGVRRLKQDMEIMNMPEKDLIPAWERCMQNVLRAKVAVEDEVTKGIQANVSIEFPSSVMLY
jgi:ubiquitin carboxyl-terminal hydrolase L5